MIFCFFVSTSMMFCDEWFIEESIKRGIGLHKICPFLFLLLCEVTADSVDQIVITFD